MSDAITLGIDTATSVQSIGLLEGRRVLEDSRRRISFDHSSSLLAHLDDALAEHGYAPSDLELIAVGIGPGSFTGVRIGLSLAKGLARGSEVPLVGVSSPACFAAPYARRNPGDYACAAYDAQRREVYTGTVVHRENEGTEQVVEDALLEPAELRERVADWSDDDRSIVLVGNGVERFPELSEWPETPNVDPLPPWEATPSGVSAALLGRQALERRGADDLNSLEPNYIRASSAEENLRD